VALERDSLKAELKECDRQLKYLDEYIRNKDLDRQQVLNTYHQLITEHEKLKNELNHSQDDLNSTRYYIHL
jgi:phage shock protein A